MKSIFIQVIFASLYAVLAVQADAQVPLETTPFWQSWEQGVYSTGMIWEDCNRDGYIDVFYANGNDMSLAQNVVYISNCGTLPVRATWYSTNYDFSGHCAVGDIDDNGYPDLIVSNYIGPFGFGTGTNSHMYLNFNGSLNASPDWYTDSIIYSFSCALGDVDGDGDYDVAFATGEGYTSVYERDRVFYTVDGVLQTSAGWYSTNGTQALDVTWGDVDNDGDLDLALCYDEMGAAVHYNYSGVLEGVPSWMSSVADPANTIIFGDVNGDDWLDLVVAFNDQLGGDGYYSVFYNNGAGSLETSPSWNSSDGGYGSAISMYDYDNDGDDDLAAGRWFDRLRIYENLGDSLTSDPVWRAQYSTVAEELAWVDVDGDGVEALADTFYSDGFKKLFYTSRHPLFSIDSVLVDGMISGIGDYCYDLISGWVSLGVLPGENVIIFYKYSYKNDLAVSNWDTYNLVYANTRNPYVEFACDISFGHAPLTVQFSDNSAGATSWLWRFGDGKSSTLQGPIHEYLSGGAFDVSLEVTLPDGWHNRTIKKMVITLADTLFFPRMTYALGDTIKAPVYLANAHPLHYMTLPITYGGPATIDYMGFDTDSCRSDYFDQVKLISFDPMNRKMVFVFVPKVLSGNPPLEPGYGRLINIYFEHKSGTGMNILDTTSLSNKTLRIDADYLEYAPFVRVGYLSDTLINRGDINGDSDINMLDILFLIAYLYKGGAAPDLFAADINADGEIDMLDTLYLVNYLYKSGPPPLK
jgi:hypothetical protein